MKKIYVYFLLITSLLLVSCHKYERKYDSDIKKDSKYIFIEKKEEQLHKENKGISPIRKLTDEEGNEKTENLDIKPNIDLNASEKRAIEYISNIENKEYLKLYEYFYKDIKKVGIEKLESTLKELNNYMGDDLFSTKHANTYAIVKEDSTVYSFSTVVRENKNINVIYSICQNEDGKITYITWDIANNIDIVNKLDEKKDLDEVFNYTINKLKNGNIDNIKDILTNELSNEISSDIVEYYRQYLSYFGDDFIKDKVYYLLNYDNGEHKYILNVTYSRYPISGIINFEYDYNNKLDKLDIF